MSDELKTLLFLPLLFSLLTLPFLNANLKAQADPNGINSLEGNREKELFLLAIYQSDRAARHFEDSVMLANGWRSDAHLASIRQLRRTDSINTLKVDQYLDVHGFPDRKNFEDEARIAPWQVLVHSQNKEIRRKHFNDLYEAYKDGDLETRRFLLFLEDEYQKSFEKNFQSYYQGSQRVEELIEELEADGLQRPKFRMP